MRQIRNLISLCIVFIFSKDLIYPDCEQYIFNEIFRDEFEGSFATRSGETIDSQNNFVVVDEETGKSLWELYFHNPVTGEPEAFVARENVTSGRKLRGTYCPEHLHLYHMLTKWEREEEAEQEAKGGTLKAKLKKGVSVVAIPINTIKKKDNTPPTLVKYEPFFQMLKQDNIPITHMTNSATGVNDIVVVVFDMRQFQSGSNARMLFDALAMHQMQQQVAPTQPMPLPTESNDGSV